LKLRETHQQHVQELNNLETERSMMLMKFTDLEEKLLEAQLQIERLTNEKLAHMLSIQKSPTDKTRVGYVASTSDIPSTSKTVFVKPTIPLPPHAYMDKGKSVVSGDGPAIAEPTQKPPTKRDLPYATIVA
jgi:NCAIR mutase (PurE)-related protein